jgi:hypothetical protein
MNKRQAKYHDKLPEIYRKNYRTGIEGKSRAKAIRSKCLDCMCWQQTEVRECEIQECPLWAYRMGAGAEIATDK